MVEMPSAGPAGLSKSAEGQCGTNSIERCMVCKCPGSMTMPVYQRCYTDLGLIQLFAFHFLIWKLMKPIPDLSTSQDYYNHWIEKDTWKICKLLHIHFKSNNNIVCVHLIFTVVESLVQMFFRWKWSSESQKCNNTTYLFSVSFWGIPYELYKMFQNRVDFAGWGNCLMIIY